MVSPIAARTPSAEPVGKAVSPSSFVPAFDVQRLKRAVDAARTEAESLILQFQQGAATDAAAFKVARLELARAKLRALKLAAAVSALRLEATAGGRIAEEAATVAVDLEAMRGRGKASSGRLLAETGDIASPSTLQADAGAEPTVDGLVQTARKVIAIARKAAVPGSPEDKAMAELQRRTGVADPAADSVGGLDLTLAGEDRAGLDISAEHPTRSFARRS